MEHGAWSMLQGASGIRSKEDISYLDCSYLVPCALSLEPSPWGQPKAAPQGPDSYLSPGQVGERLSCYKTANEGNRGNGGGGASR